MNDKSRGLYNKYTVMRNDGSSELGGKHHSCDYFVLDMDHDKHAIAALDAYIKSCATEYPRLAADLRAQVYALKKEFGTPCTPAPATSDAEDAARLKYLIENVGVGMPFALCASDEVKLVVGSVTISSRMSWLDAVRATIDAARGAK